MLEEVKELLVVLMVRASVSGAQTQFIKRTFNTLSRLVELQYPGFKTRVFLEEYIEKLRESKVGSRNYGETLLWLYQVSEEKKEIKQNRYLW